MTIHEFKCKVIAQCIKCKVGFRLNGNVVKGNSSKADAYFKAKKHYRKYHNGT